MNANISTLFFITLFNLDFIVWNIHIGIIKDEK